MRNWIVCATLLLSSVGMGGAQSRAVWRAATGAELEGFLPARAPVEKERIETEMRTATGIRDERGRMVAAVVLITAGYAAEGKYSHYLLTQSGLRVGDVRLGPGAYVVGWTRGEEGLLVHVYAAETGMERGSAVARAPKQAVRVEPFRIWPPGEKNVIQIGRFYLDYRLEP